MLGKIILTLYFRLTFFPNCWNSNEGFLPFPADVTARQVQSRHMCWKNCKVQHKLHRFPYPYKKALYESLKFIKNFLQDKFSLTATTAINSNFNILFSAASSFLFPFRNYIWFILQFYYALSSVISEYCDIIFLSALSVIQEDSEAERILIHSLYQMWDVTKTWA